MVLFLKVLGDKMKYVLKGLWTINIACFLIVLLSIVSCEISSPLSEDQTAENTPQLEDFAASAPIKDQFATIKIIEGYRNGQHPIHERLVYLTAFGAVNWVIYLEADQVWPEYDGNITIKGLYLGTIERRNGAFHILVEGIIQ